MSPSYTYHAERCSRDNSFLNKVSLDRPLPISDGTDSDLALSAPAPDADPAERRKPIHVPGTLVIDVNAQGYHGPTAFDNPDPLLAIARFLNDCVAALEPPSWEGEWPPVYVESITYLRPQANGVGSASYSRSFLAKRLQSKCVDPVDAVITTITDHQASLVLLRHCIQAMTNHLHFVDVVTGSNTSSSPDSSCESEFSTAVRDQHVRLLSHTAGRTITPLAWLIATSHVGDGGLGLRDVVANNLQGFVFPLARSLQHAVNGISPLEALHMLDMNCSSSAPAGLFPKADRQWRQDLAEEGKHPSTHWFSGSYHARLPSQWAKQVLGFNVTHALMRYYSNAAFKLRRQEVIQPSRAAPVGVSGISRSSILAPRTSYF